MSAETTTGFKPKKSVALSGTTAGNTALCTVGRTGNDLHYRGYDVLVGGQMYTGYADHPRVLVDLPRLGIQSTAAGRYQLLRRYFDASGKLLVVAHSLYQSQLFTYTSTLRRQ